MLASHLTHGMLLAGMANCAKHFPGHGWADADSHVALPVDARPRDQILADGAPYRWLGAMLAGVMPAHVVFSQVDSMPAGFSSKWIKHILRGELAFSGAVFSDDLLMAGASSAGTVADRAAAALAAGCDFALVCNDLAAMDLVLGNLEWKRSAQFDARLRRLLPRGPAMSMAELRESDIYSSALQDVGRLNGVDASAV